MQTTQARDEAAAVTRNLASITGSHRRTLDAIFRHPSPHNLEWDDVVALIGKIGDVREEADNKFVFENQAPAMGVSHSITFPLRQANEAQSDPRAGRFDGAGVLAP